MQEAAENEHESLKSMLKTQTSGRVNKKPQFLCQAAFEDTVYTPDTCTGAEPNPFTSADNTRGYTGYSSLL